MIACFYLKVKFKNFLDYAHVVGRYYYSYSFAKIDLSLLFLYLFTNPFRVSRRYLVKKGEKEIYTYGETPLATLETIFRACAITPFDTVFELGSGRGRGCFWLRQWFGCEVVGIEYIPLFVKKAKLLIDFYQIDKISFRCEDFLCTDFTGATVVYLYGTCLTTEQIGLLIDQLEVLTEDVKVITVSYALTEFRPACRFKVTKHFQGVFPWGEADVYIHNLIDYKREDTDTNFRK